MNALATADSTSARPPRNNPDAYRAKGSDKMPPPSMVETRLKTALGVDAALSSSSNLSRGSVADRLDSHSLAHHFEEFRLRHRSVLPGARCSVKFTLLPTKEGLSGKCILGTIIIISHAVLHSQRLRN